MRVLVLFVLMAISCGSPPKPITQTESAPPPKPGESVEVVHLDTITRAPTDNIQVFTDRSAVGKTYIEIALLSVRGEEQQRSIDELIVKAKELGATAIVITENERKRVGSLPVGNLILPLSVRSVKAVAIVVNTSQ